MYVGGNGFWRGRRGVMQGLCGHCVSSQVDDRVKSEKYNLTDTRRASSLCKKIMCVVTNSRGVRYSEKCHVQRDPANGRWLTVATRQWRMAKAQCLMMEIPRIGRMKPISGSYKPMLCLNWTNCNVNNGGPWRTTLRTVRFSPCFKSGTLSELLVVW